MSSRPRSNSHAGGFACADTSSNRQYTYGNRRYSESSLRLAHLTGQRGLRNAILGILMDRLEMGGVNTRGLDPALLNHCVPKDCDNHIDWEAIIHNPIQVTDHTLSKALNLRIATNKELPEKEERRVILYVRSFQLTVKQLLDVISLFGEAGLETATTLAWSESVKFLKPDDNVYIRYVGRTERSALLRHRHDIAFQSIKSGFLSKFLSALEKIHPLAIDAVMLYEVPGVCLQQFGEQKEQALIALLNLSSLLNQRICEVWSFTPTEDHKMVFVNLKTDTFSFLSSSDFKLLDCELITAWATEIQEYTRAHKLSVCHPTRQALEFSDDIRSAIIRQAQPSMFRERFVIFLTLGAEMSLDAWRNAQEFFLGSSDSATLMKNYLKRLWSWEKGEPIFEKDLRTLISAGVLPFINLCPWLKAEGKDLQQAVMFAKEYVLLTKPMIILTLGTKASSSAKSGFHHPFGYSATQSFEEKVGRLELVNCEDTAFIQIACFHPGKGRFCRNPGTFSKVFDMTLWILLFTITVCIDTEKAFRNQSRKVWCENIRATVENKLQENGFYKCFERLNAKFHSESPKSQSIITFRGRPSLGIATRSVTVCGPLNSYNIHRASESSEDSITHSLLGSVSFYRVCAWSTDVSPTKAPSSQSMGSQYFRVA